MGAAKAVTVVAASEDAWELIEGYALDDAFLWRLKKFGDLKFSVGDAARLAAAGADWQQAERLLAAGCPANLVHDILT